MKDGAGRVIYVGKAGRSPQPGGQLFLKAAAEDPRTARLVREIRDIDFLETGERGRRAVGRGPLDQGHSAEIQQGAEGRQELSLPGDHHAGGVSGRSRARRRSGGRSHGPFANVSGCARATGAAKIFRFRTCSLDIQVGGRTLAVVPPLPAGFDPPVLGRRATCESPRKSTARTSAVCSACSREQEALLEELRRRCRRRRRAL